MKKILIVDDDIHIGNMLEEILTKEGYTVDRAYSGSEAVLLLERSKPDLILLDLMLPGLSGEEVLQKIKGIPVIIVSAKVSIDSKVDLLLGGAVDYVTKPFNTRELLARIEVQLRDRERIGNDTLTFDDINLNLNEHIATINGCALHLTRTEFAILKLLMKNPNSVITKSQLLDKISEDTPDCTESSLKVHMSNLRKKLREVGNKEYIEAVWGIGFKMEIKNQNITNS